MNFLSSCLYLLSTVTCIHHNARLPFKFTKHSKIRKAAVLKIWNIIGNGINSRRKNNMKKSKFFCYRSLSNYVLLWRYNFFLMQCSYLLQFNNFIFYVHNCLATWLVYLVPSEAEDWSHRGLWAAWHMRQSISPAIETLNFNKSPLVPCHHPSDKAFIFSESKL